MGPKPNVGETATTGLQRGDMKLGLLYESIQKTPRTLHAVKHNVNLRHGLRARTPRADPRTLQNDAFSHVLATL
jgi:hypothetical protein